MMKVLVVVALLVTLISYSSSEGIDDLEADELLSLMANEQTRAKACTPRYYDCSHDRHSCCRSSMFKDVCTCFYPEGGDNKEVCTCQQPKHLKYMEKATDKIKNLFG
uniref:Toxin-like structure LSTX-D3 n=1 Tax=Lycosa singoriensis TaxID=434756 RepID=TXZ03_LYCSI|nr:RecName: Full=Toxin-like structure LSTX-D3; Flags: Precursor [Lycosa singoriensis]ACI41358.1 toxin-like structure LSTX-D3 precursor [Lycosa singoriensis]CAS03627.1 toxin-like structure LSTX-D3 precursor [Lycosa singoriensis]